MARVCCEKINKIYPNDVHAVQDVSLEVADGEFLVLVGPSGCGKSTALRMIAGLEEISSGTIKIGDKVVNDIEPKHRDVAMVFQDYALYPHMTVRQNLEFGLSMRKVPRDQRNKSVGNAAEILGLNELLSRKPAQLSGGQKQRVAVGRAIVREPQVFLFDEPLSNLDAKLRAEMRTEIARLHQRLGVTTIYVTHDQVEAMTLGQRIVMMLDGTIQQVGTPLEVYTNPVNQFVAGFLGTPQMNFIEVGYEQGGGNFSFGGNALPVPEKYLQAGNSILESAASFGIRPEHVSIYPTGDGAYPATVIVVEPLGSKENVLLNINGIELTSETNPGLDLKPGMEVGLGFDEKHGHLFNSEGDNLI